MHFQRRRYVSNQSSYVSINLGDDRSKSQEMAAFFEIQDSGDRHIKFVKLGNSDVIDMIQIEVTMFPLIFFNRSSPEFYGSKCGGFSDRRPPNSKFESTKPSKGTCINRNATLSY